MKRLGSLRMKPRSDLSNRLMSNAVLGQEELLLRDVRIQSPEVVHVPLAEHEEVIHLLARGR